MSTSEQHPYLREAAILTRAIENVLRKLVRLLMGRISLTRLQEMLRLIFVQEAQAQLERETPGKSVPMTKLALLTGLDTRTLGKLTEEKQKSTTVHKSRRFLREITPECSVLDLWQVNPKYIDEETGKPLELALKGEAPSFESLMLDALSSRGITAGSLLERMEGTGAVKVDHRAQTVTMLESRFWPFRHESNTAMVEIGLISVGNLLETVAHNLTTKGQEDKSFYHRSTWTHRLQRSNQGTLRSELRSLLDAAERDATTVLATTEENEPADDQLTAGVCLFYFEEAQAN